MISESFIIIKPVERYRRYLRGGGGGGTISGVAIGVSIGVLLR